VKRILSAEKVSVASASNVYSYSLGLIHKFDEEIGGQYWLPKQRSAFVNFANHLV